MRLCYAYINICGSHKKFCVYISNRYILRGVIKSDFRIREGEILYIFLMVIPEKTKERLIFESFLE